MRLLALTCLIAPILIAPLTIDPLDDVISTLESTEPTSKALSRCLLVLKDNSVNHLHGKAKAALAEFYLGPGPAKGVTADGTKAQRDSQKALQQYQSLADDKNDPGT
jgi:hypothetical protein